MNIQDRMIQSELAKYEAVIERGMQTTIETGMAMKAIRDKELYRVQYKTFEAYVKERWGYAKARAYQLIEAAEVDANLSTMVDKSARPHNERQLREIAKAPVEMQAEVVRKVVEKAAEENRKPTAKDYKQAVEQVVGEVVDDSPESDDKSELPSAKIVKGKPLSPEEQMAANRKLARDYIAKAVNAVDDYHAVKPNQRRRAEIVRMLQQAGEKLW